MLADKFQTHVCGHLHCAYQDTDIKIMHAYGYLRSLKQAY